MKKVVVIGGGAAGLMAALIASKKCEVIFVIHIMSLLDSAGL